MGGLIGNTSFLGIPVAIALLPTNTINYTIGFDLGTTLFAWMFGPILLQENISNFSNFNFKKIISFILGNPASKGIIGVFITYLFNAEEIIGNYLWLPANFVIFMAIIVVGSKLGIIFSQKRDLFNFSDGIHFSIILKLILFPSIIYVICYFFNIQKYESFALILQGLTPSAISTILMAEAYKTRQQLAAKIFFISTIISIGSITIVASII